MKRSDATTFTFSTGQQVTLTPPTGAKLAALQILLGVRFAYLQNRPPTDEKGQRRVITKLAKALVPYVQGMHVDALVTAFYADPHDIAKLMAAVYGGHAYTPRRKPR